MVPSWYGDCLPSRDFPMLVDLAQQGRFPLSKFVTETNGLKDDAECVVIGAAGDLCAATGARSYLHPDDRVL